MSFIVTPKQLDLRATLYSQLASLLRAGVTLPKALDHLIQEPPSWRMRRPLIRILHELNSGQTFAVSLRTVQDTPLFDIALLQAGEQSGRLDQCFRLLADHYTNSAQLARDLIVGIAYPIGLLHLAILIFPVSLLPKLVWQGEVAPFVLQKVEVLGSLYAVVILLIFLCQGRRGEKLRLLVEKISDRIPFLGKARQSLALSRLSSALEALINAGVSFIDSWELSASASGSPTLKSIVMKWRPKMEEGATPSQLVTLSRRFPRLFSTEYHSAEEVGQQDEALRRMHIYYQEMGLRQTRQFIRMMSVVVFFGVAIFLAYQIITFWQNYYNNLFNAI